jgi:hypothetical protein
VRKIIERRVRGKKLVPVTIEGAGRAEHWAMPDMLDAPPSPENPPVHILSPFDPLVIQRKRLALFPDDARAVMQKLIGDRIYPQAGDAGMLLDSLDEGRYVPE